MGNLEKPLTWGLVIVFIGYLFAANCECGEESTCSLNNEFNFSDTEVLTIDVPENVEEVAVEATINDTTIVVETNIDSEEVEIDTEVEIEE